MKENACPNCGAAKERYVILPDMENALVLPIEGMSWKCPDCKEAFCNACFEINYVGNGSTFFCPHCKAKLAFPKDQEPPLRLPISLN